MDSWVILLSEFIPLMLPTLSRADSTNDWRNVLLLLILSFLPTFLSIQKRKHVGPDINISYGRLMPLFPRLNISHQLIKGLSYSEYSILGFYNGLSL